MNIRLFFRSAFAGGVLLGVISSAHAEGGNISIPGVHGVVRIVRTTRGQGYRATSGTINMSFFHPVNVQGAVDKIVDPLYDKPQVYLGATPVLAAGGTTEVEGGLSAELGSWGTPSTGWGAFMARANGGNSGNLTANPRIYSGDPTNPDAIWRGGTYQPGQDSTSGAYTGVSGSITSNLTFNVYVPSDFAVTATSRGSYAMTISGLGDPRGNQTFFYNVNATQFPINTKDPAITTYNQSTGAIHYVAPWAAENNTVETSNDQTQCRVKHEVAQTRGTSQASLGDFALDGSWVQATWSGCQVNGTDWVAAMTDQAATGFNAPANQGDLIYDKLYKGTKTPASNFIVQFGTSTFPIGSAGSLALRNGSQSAGDPVGDPDRYKAETCIINLATATRPVGESVSW